LARRGCDGAAAGFLPVQLRKLGVAGGKIAASMLG